MALETDAPAAVAPAREPGLADTLRPLLHYLAPYRARAALIFVLLSIDAGFAAALPLGLRFLVDRAITPREARYVAPILALLVAGTLVAALASVARDYLYAHVGSRVVNDVRLRLFDQLQRLSHEFYGRTQSGDVLSRFSTDLAAVETVVTSVLPWALMALIGIVASLLVMLFLEWHLALLALIAVPLAAVGPRLLAPRAALAGYALKREEASITSAVAEHLHTHPVVRVFGLERARRAAFGARLERAVDQSRRFGFLSGLVQRTPNLAVALVHALVLAVASVLAFDGVLSVGSLVSFDLVYLGFAAAVASLTEISPSLLRASAGMQRIEELLREPSGVVDTEQPRALPAFREALALRDVSFGYGAGPATLSGLSLTIPRGSSVAIVGRSGSGKSSVLHLLMRFYDPRAGAVTIDGQDLRGVRQHELRARMAVVFQDSLLFDGTVADNIRAGKLDAAQTEIEAAARAAELHDFVMTLSHGYDTPIGERGNRLSGGQRQRLAIARALVRKPEILLLDEATSALDGNTESAVERTLAEVGKGRTVVSVTHRLGSVARADRIFVLDAGMLVEQGSHDELLRQNGTYAKLWKKQHGFQISADGEAVQVEAERLSLIPMLSYLDAPILERVAHRLVVEHVPAGRLVLQEGDPGDHLYLIVRGRVEVSKRDPDGLDQRVGVLESGDHFGEVALLHDVPRTATVRTLTPNLFLTLQRAQFLELLASTPGLRERLEERVRATTASESGRPRLT